jgi:coenzyme PQQ precursor peptide PqqA
LLERSTLAERSTRNIVAPLRHEHSRQRKRRMHMIWTTPTLVEICIGLEINGYLPAEF